jgi:hypothetical protein
MPWVMSRAVAAFTIRSRFSSACFRLDLPIGDPK